MDREKPWLPLPALSASDAELSLEPSAGGVNRLAVRVEVSSSVDESLGDPAVAMPAGGLGKG